MKAPAESTFRYFRSTCVMCSRPATNTPGIFAGWMCQYHADAVTKLRNKKTPVAAGVANRKQKRG